MQCVFNECQYRLQRSVIRFTYMDQEVCTFHNKPAVSSVTQFSILGINNEFVDRVTNTFYYPQYFRRG